jgi:hypothetical protein
MAITHLVPRRQARITLLGALLVVVAGLLLGPAVAPQAAHAGAGHAQPGTGQQLTVAWTGGSSRLEIVGLGFRNRSQALVRVGNRPSTQVRVDDNGTVRIPLELDPAAASQPGTSVLVAGRASSGGARTLVSAVPPRVRLHGPIDLMPWSVGVLAALLGVGAVLRRFIARAGQARTAG